MEIKEIISILTSRISKAGTNFGCEEVAEAQCRHIQSLLSNLPDDTVVFGPDDAPFQSDGPKTACVIYGVDFSGQKLERVNFDATILVDCNFKEATLVDCRFRKGCMVMCDMRYMTVSGGTFENAKFVMCDFYRSYFCDLIRFWGARFYDCSLNNAFFSGGALVERWNFPDSRLLQEKPKSYKLFLAVWEMLRNPDDKITKHESIEDKIEKRHYELFLIYRNLYSAFGANGFSSDANWAYAKSCRQEREIIFKDNVFNLKKKLGVGKRIGLFFKGTFNAFMDLCFGYGDSLVKILGTYIFVILVFTVIFYYNGNVGSFLKAFTISFKNMVGISSPELTDENNVFLDFLNLIQTTIGILITGIFGFILGVKMRRQ